MEVHTEVSSVRVGEGSEVGPMRDALSRARRATSLRAVTDTVRLDVGAVMQSKELPLVMVDSAGVELGSLPMYDTAVGSGGVVEIVGMGLRGVRPGVQPVTFRIPRPFRSNRTDPQPSATIYFEVQP